MLGEWLCITLSGHNVHFKDSHEGQDSSVEGCGRGKPLEANYLLFGES